MTEVRYSEYKTRDAGLHAHPSRTRHKPVNAQAISCVINVHVFYLQQATDMANRRRDRLRCIRIELHFCTASLQASGNNPNKSEFHS